MGYGFRVPAHETPSRASARAALPYLYLTLAPLFWSGNVILGRALRGAISPTALTFWRWVIALALLLPVAGAELWRKRAVVRSRWKILAVLGFLGFFLYQALSYAALTATTALNVLLISSATPLVVALVGWVVFREQVSPRLAAGILLSLLGVLAVVTRGDPRSLASLGLNAGDLLMLGATVVWALYSVLLRRRPPELRPVGLLAVTALAGMVFTTPVFLWRTVAGETVAPVLPNVLGLAYIGLFASVFAYLFWNQGVAAVGAGRAGLFINLMPVFGAVLAVVFLRESLAPYHLVGALLVLAGILLGSVRRRGSLDRSRRSP